MHTRMRNSALIFQIFKANVILIMQYAVSSLVPILLVPHIVKSIGLAEYGNLAVIMGWSSFGAVVVQYAFQLTGPRRIAQLDKDEKISDVFLSINFAKFILFLVVTIVMSTTFFFIQVPPSSSSHAWLIFFILPFTAALNSVWFLQVQDKFGSIALIAIAGTLLSLSIGFLLVDATDPRAVDYAVLVNIAGPVFTGVCTFLLSFAIVKSDWRTLNIGHVKDCLKEGFPLFISQFLSMLYMNTGPIIINYFVDARAAGSYSVIERLVNAILSAVLLTHTAAFPRLAYLIKTDALAYRRLMGIIISLYATVVLVISSIAWLNRDYILHFLYGEYDKDHLQLFLLGCGWIFFGIFGPALTGHLTNLGRSTEVWAINSRILLLSLGMGLPFVHFFGGSGWLAALITAQFVVVYLGVLEWRRWSIELARVAKE